jgi:EAL domain-containing protein (putative c-di-GMP-specific phosphodiesterase class I)
MINRIGQVMGKRTIAEFAESAQIVEALRAMGVDYAQGYALARPRPFVLPWTGAVA